MPSSVTTTFLIWQVRLHALLASRILLHGCVEIAADLVSRRG